MFSIANVLHLNGFIIITYALGKGKTRNFRIRVYDVLFNKSLLF